ALSSLTLGSGVTEIGYGAFLNCTSLKSVTIPGSVTIIYSLAFGYTYDEESGERTLDESFIIYGYTDTYAETYANYNNLTFISLGEYTPAEEPTTEPATEEPTTAEPTTAEPTTAEPTTTEPTTAEPTTAEPTTAEPTTAESTTAEPTTAEPTTTEPTTAEPTTAEPTTAEPTTVPAATEPVTADGQAIIILGDVNGDNRVSAADARLALRIAAMLYSGTDKELAAADLDGNGKITASEARTILRVAASLEDSLGTIVFSESSTTVLTTEELATAAHATAEPATATPATEEPATVENPEGTAAYSDFPDEMKAFIEGKYGFSGTIDADGSSESVIVKTDGTNIKLSITVDMDSYGEYIISVIALSSTGSNEETADTYVVCENTGKIMSLSTFRDAVKASGGGDIDLTVSAETYAIEIDEIKDSLYAYVTTETGDSGVKYTVYSIGASDGAVKFYFDGDIIASIVTYNADGSIDSAFVFDEFYTDIPDSEFDISVYDNITDLMTFYGFSLLNYYL
ncbi:MAG: leucine-rich repeat protein, partial [Clostridiales bacterium]|nr:leucine-rich repeat protein [Clostridiales bacterium]